jgi:hypothetical protein
MAPSTPVSPKDSNKSSKNVAPAPNKPKIKDPGVGGDTDTSFTFKIGVLDSTRLKLDNNRSVRIELAPARRSTYEKGGMQPPGASHGMEFRTRINLARMPIPGAKPTYQQMGISEETLEWVGAFIGADVEEGNSFNYTNAAIPTRDTSSNAWDQSCDLSKIFKKGQELGIELRWHQESKNKDTENEHIIGFTKKEKDKIVTSIFTGFVKEFVRSYATEQRVYYRIVFVLTNTENASDFIEKESAANIKLAFPFLNEKDKPISVGMPNPEDIKANKELSYKLIALNGYKVEEYKDLATNLENENYVKDLVTSLRNPDGSVISADETKEIKKALDTYVKYQPKIGTTSTFSPGEYLEIEMARSTLSKLQEVNNASEINKANAGLASISIKKISNKTPIFLRNPFFNLLN